MNAHARYGRAFGALRTVLVLGIALTTTLATAADVPPTPAPIVELVSARPFTLETPSEHGWRLEKPRITSGYLLVLRVDPELVLPRQTPQPVLYVGRQTAERVNHGDLSGHVIAIVPGVIDDPSHPDHLDLTKTMIWFGSPELPERVDAATIDREQRDAVRAGLAPLPAKRVGTAVERGGDTLRLADKRELLREAARLIQRHSPQERELIDRILISVGP